MNLESIVCVLNPVQAMDLGYILSLTPASRRVDVALAFAALNMAQWCKRAGLGNPVSAARWMAKDARMPLGAAYRLAAVLGVDAVQLFSFWIE